MIATRTRRLRRILSIVCVLAAAWGLAVMLSGGFVVTIEGVRISSRSPRNPFLLALLSAVGAWALTPPLERRDVLNVIAAFARGVGNQVRRSVDAVIHIAGTLPRSAAPSVAAIASIVVIGVALDRGAPYVGGSDVYGYVSQAHLWTMGTLRVEQPIVGQVDWPAASAAFTPLGYRSSPDGTLLPVYSPGLPLVMALFEWLAGPAAVFYVVPLLGGVAVWATYLMGTRLAGQAAGASAAVLLAASPAFLFQLMFPMSDVPVTAWWALTLALVTREGRMAAAGAGLTASAAILTRPNLAPLAALPGLLLLYKAVRSRELYGHAAQRTLLFTAGVAAAGLVLAIVNTRLWGSPFATGYGSVDTLYSWDNLLPNLNRYPRWLVRTETPLVLLAVAAPFALRNRARARLSSWRPRTLAAVWLAFIAGVFLSYVFHLPNDTWFWLRYVLPAFPALFALTTAVLWTIFAGRRRGVRVIAVGTVVAAVAWHGVAFGIRDGIFRFREGERKYEAIGTYIARALPAHAAFISKLHSGSIRYYSDRLTLQYEGIAPNALDRVIEDLRRLGYYPYIVLETSEEAPFRERFAARTTTGALEWAPVVLLDHATRVRIYDPAQRQAATTVIR